MKKNHVLSFSIFFYINFVSANIAGNNKEYQYCRKKRKNVETMRGRKHYPNSRSKLPAGLFNKTNQDASKHHRYTRNFYFS